MGGAAPPTPRPAGGGRQQMAEENEECRSGKNEALQNEEYRSAFQGEDAKQ